MSNCLYLFCFARPALLPALEGTGVDGHSPLFMQTFRDITAIVSMMPLEECRGPSAEARMRDLAWVGPRACRHEEVVEHVMRHSPVLPVRFGTIFSSLKSLEAIVSKHYEAISSFLVQVADAEEWAIKGLLDRAKAEEAFLFLHLARKAENLASLSPGMRYFQEQRIRADVVKDLHSWLNKVCKGVADQLNRHSCDFCPCKVHPHGALGSDKEMLLNWAFLVPRTNVADFFSGIYRANVQCANLGLFLHCSGPWPPYSFCPSLNEKEAE